MKENAITGSSYANHLLRLMGLHNEPYNLNDELLCMKAIALFNLALDQHAFLLASFLREGSPEKLKAKERPPGNLTTGGFINLAITNIMIEKTIKESVSDRLLKRFSVLQLPQNRTKSIVEQRNIKFRESLIFLTYTFCKANNRFPNWKRILGIVPGMCAMNKESMVSCLRAEFESLLKEHEMNKVCKSVEKLTVGKCTSKHRNH